MQKSPIKYQETEYSNIKIKKLTQKDKVGFIPGNKTKQHAINVIPYVNTIKYKNHMIISIDTEKAFDKVHHRLVIKTLNKTGSEGNLFNLIKNI